MRDIPTGVPVFYSGGNKDAAVTSQAEPSRGVQARKRVHTVQVRFADHACEVQALEGIVPAKRGDAIVRGMFGELWPVARDAFAGKYQPVPPLEMGAPGPYLSLPIEVIATPMHTPFEVVLPDGASRLHGVAGDWLVDYRDGSLGIVNADIFKATYEILEDA